MNERDDLITACALSPQDSIHHLILADWLEENGSDQDRSWATILRVQNDGTHTIDEQRKVIAATWNRVVGWQGDGRTTVLCRADTSSLDPKVTVSGIEVDHEQWMLYWRHGMIREFRATPTIIKKHGRALWADHRFTQVAVYGLIPYQDSKYWVWDRYARASGKTIPWWLWIRLPVLPKGCFRHYYATATEAVDEMGRAALAYCQRRPRPRQIKPLTASSPSQSVS